MLNALRQKILVKEGGKIEISSTELPAAGVMVEVIIFLPEDEPDTSNYLLSTEANRQQLSKAIAHVEKRENLITFTPEEWHEKYRI